MLAAALAQTRWAWGIVIMPKTAWWRAFGPEYSELFGQSMYGSGTYDHRKEVAVWEDAPLPAFDYGINGGLGSMEIDLPRRLGEIGEQGDAAEDPDIGFGNLVEVAVVDEDGDDSVLVWRGRIEGYSSAVGPDAETVKVTLVPFVARLADAFFVGPKTFTATDPKDMLAWFLDQGYVQDFALDSASQALGATYDRTFEKQTIKQIFDDIRELAGADWYYLVKPDFKVLFAQYPATSDHVLTLGKEVTEVEFLKDVSRRRTRVIIYGKGVTATASSAEFDSSDPLDLVVVEDRITSQVVAEQVAQSLLDSREGADLRVRCKVLDGNGPDTADGRGYDIESLRPGQTCRIVNPENVGQVPIFGFDTYGGGGFYDGSAAEMSKQVLPIATIRYGFDYAELELSTRQPDQVQDVQALLDEFQRHVTEGV